MAEIPPGAQARANLTGAAIALAAFAIFAAHDSVVKALGASYAPTQILFFSTLLGFPLAVVLLLRDPTEANLRPRRPGWTAMRTAATTVTGLSAFYAFSTLPLAQAYAILFATPLFITVLSIPVLGEKVGIRRWSAVAVGLCGVLVVVRPGLSPLELGHLAALAAAIGASTAAVVVRKIGQEERAMVLMLFPMLANVAVMGALLPFSYRPMPGSHLAALALLAALAFGASLLMIAAYRRGEAASVAPMQYSQILWATLYGALFFNEGLDLATALGAAIVIGSGLYILVREAQVDNSSRPVQQTRSRPETGTWPRISHLLRRIDRDGQAQGPRSTPGPASPPKDRDPPR